MKIDFKYNTKYNSILLKIISIYIYTHTERKKGDFWNTVQENVNTS